MALRKILTQGDPTLSSLEDFHVPGRASVDLIASWFGAANAAVILTREQYMKGFYTKREAGYIMTNFSLVSDAAMSVELSFDTAGSRRSRSLSSTRLSTSSSFCPAISSLTIESDAAARSRTIDSTSRPT